MLCRCHGGSQATGRAGSKRRSKKVPVTSFARSIAGTQVKVLFLGVAAKTTRDKAPCGEERAVYAVSTERVKAWKKSELGESEDSSRETSYHG